jgi:PAS domain S-box-containing protein
MNTTDTVYALLDKELNVVTFNQKAAKFVGNKFNQTQASGDRVADYFSEESFNQFLDYSAEVLRGKNISYEINYPQPGGLLSWYYVRLFPITNDKNEILGMMLALSDITERKNTEESLKTAYEQIQDHISSIKDMAWKQSHFIRSPVANLKGLAAMLKEEPGDSELLKFINIELNRLDEVIIEMAEQASSHS